LIRRYLTMMVKAEPQGVGRLHVFLFPDGEDRARTVRAYSAIRRWPAR